MCISLSSKTWSLLSSAPNLVAWDAMDSQLWWWVCCRLDYPCIASLLSSPNLPVLNAKRSLCVYTLIHYPFAEGWSWRKHCLSRIDAYVGVFDWEGQGGSSNWCCWWWFQGKLTTLTLKEVQVTVREIKHKYKIRHIHNLRPPIGMLMLFRIFVSLANIPICAECVCQGASSRVGGIGPKGSWRWGLCSRLGRNCQGIKKNRTREYQQH